jgi:predicted  nucleic acid-binding Zn-ribbon protein
MAKATKAKEAINDLETELEEAHDKISRLEDQVEGLETELMERSDEASSDVDAMRHQLDSLAVAIESGRPSIPQTPAQWMRCLQEIGRGGEWEHGTWR